MTQAIDIIKRSMRQMKVLGTGETPSAAESADMLTALNAMLAAWADDKMLVYVNTKDVISLTAGQASYSIGPSGSTIAGRPISIDPATYVTFQGVDYLLRVLNQADYDAIPYKTLQGIPGAIYADMAMPNVTVYLYYVPTQAMTLNLISQKQLISFASLTTDVSMPPGYEQAIIASLSEVMAPEFGVQLDPQIVKMAALGRKRLKRVNAVIPTLDAVPLISKARFASIVSGFQ